MNFDAFWKWLKRRQRTIDTLGSSKTKKQFTITAQDTAGEIRAGAKQTSFYFSKEVAHLTWVRFHGFKQAEDYICKEWNLGVKRKSPYLMTSSYAFPNKGSRLPQNWLECPQLIQCSGYIAAAIFDFLPRQKQTKNNQPKKNKHTNI